MLDIVYWLFVIANVLMLGGTILMIIVAVRNRDVLRGYSLFGSILTFIPMVIIGLCYILMQNWISFGLASVSIIFWLLVSVFLIRNKVKGNKLPINK